MRGRAPNGELVVMDGKEPRHGSGTPILTAVSIPSQYYLGSAVVEVNTPAGGTGKALLIMYARGRHLARGGTRTHSLT